MRYSNNIPDYFRLAPTPHSEDSLPLKFFKRCVVQHFTFLSHKTNEFHVAMDLHKNRSQKRSNCGKNIRDTVGCTSFVPFFVHTTLWHHLWSVLELMHANMEFICEVEKLCIQCHCITLFTQLWHLFLANIKGNNNEFQSYWCKMLLFYQPHNVS